MLDQIAVEGSVVTIDAAGCQKAIAEQVTSAKGDYVFALKGNQGNLFEEVSEYVIEHMDNDFADVPVKRHSEKSKGHGFNQPLLPHQHWHLDIAYLNIRGTFYYIASLLDGFSRSVVHWEIREQMREGDVETIIQRARERYPNATPRVITDNGPQFVAKDFKEFIRVSGMTHVRTSPYYPQSNGKIERFHRTLKSDCIRPKTPLNMEDAKRIVHQFVDEYNQVRLHSAIGYITPHDMLAGRQKEIHAARDAKLEEARLRRAQARKSQPSESVSSEATPRSDGPQATDYTASIRTYDGSLVGHNTRNAPMLLATGNDTPAVAAIPTPTLCQ